MKEVETLTGYVDTSLIQAVGKKREKDLNLMAAYYTTRIMKQPKIY